MRCIKIAGGLRVYFLLLIAYSVLTLSAQNWNQRNVIIYQPSFQ